MAQGATSSAKGSSRTGRAARTSKRKTGVQKLNINGENFVLIPEAQYEELVDKIEATKIAKRIASGEEEVFPSEVVDALLDGENPIRVFRCYRGMTVSELASAVKKTQPYLSELEAGKKNGSVETLRTIANALGIDLELLA